MTWFEDLWQDFRYAIRTLRQKPGFTAVALLTLALGVGATSVMFTLIDGVLLKPLPYREPDKLVNLQEKTDWSTQFGNVWAFTYPNFIDCKREIRSAEMIAFHDSGGTISALGNAEHVDDFEISSNLFSVLGIRLLQGRAFLPEEDRPGGAPVVIIGHSLWQRLFTGNPAAIGMILFFDGQPRTVVGILPASFRLDGDEVDVFTPIGQDTSPVLLNREAHGIGVWARLRPGATLARANAELAVISRQPEERYPKSNKGRTFIAEPLRPDVGDVQSTLWLLLGAVASFHHLNRGVTIVAKSVDYDNKNQRVRLVLSEAQEEERLFGILDGGNTNERINKWREELSDEDGPAKLAETFVNAQVLIPTLNGDGELSPEMLALLNDIKEARNTSVQVKSKSLADARRHFDVLKGVLSKEKFYQDVSWREGEGAVLMRCRSSPC